MNKKCAWHAGTTQSCTAAQPGSSHESVDIEVPVDVVEVMEPVELPDVADPPRLRTWLK